MSWLSTWFIVELIGVEAATDLSEPKTFKNVSLQMIDKTFTFRRMFHKNLHHIRIFDVRYEWQKWKRYSFTASASLRITCKM